MPINLENIAKGVEIISAVFPSVAGIIVTLKNGQKVDLTDLLNDTEDVANEKIDQANEFLKRPGE